MTGPNVSGANPGPNSALLPLTLQNQQTTVNPAPANYTFATLPAAATYAGVTLYTSDQGPLFSNGKAWIPIGSSIISTIKSAIAASLQVNGVTVQPLTAPPAWVTATLYYQGTAVTNGVNAYVLITQGTSGATGPTGTGSAPITDGTAVWYYWGPTFTSSPLAPTVTNVGFGARYTGLYWTTNLNTYAVGSSKIQDATNFLFYGSIGTDGLGANGSYLWNQNALIGGVSFMTDAPQFQIVLPANIGPSLNIYVNGVPVTLGMTASNQSVSGQFFSVVFSDRRPRLITLEVQTNLIPGFYGVLMNDTVSHVWAPAPPIAFNMSFVGTSYFDGSGQHPVTPSLGIASQIARYLGVSNYWIDRLGSGTGYVATGGTGPFGLATRLAAMVATNPQLLLISGGGINDQTSGVIAPLGAASLAAFNVEYAAALAYYTAVRAALPSTIIIVIGSETGSSGPSAAVLNMEAAVAAAVVAMGDANILFIPQASTKASSAWISGTGNAPVPNGTGNSDFLISTDNIHPVQLGANEIAFRSANAVRNIISTLN